MNTLEDKIDRLLLLIPKIERLEKLHADLLLKRPSRAEQAKQAGCSPSTLWRREQRARLRRMAGDY